jgi:co-chaperonin GroES (HSP10)
MRVYPIKDNLLIEPIEQAAETRGGIRLPDNRSKPAIVEGMVISTGPKVSSVQQGDIVVFDKHSPTLREIKAGTTSVDQGKKFLLMKECDLMAVYV